MIIGFALNYYQLFGLTPQFIVDTKQLADIYQTLQKSVHPDRFAHGSSQQQLIAVQRSATINDGYQTLKNPLKRAEYLLTLRATPMPNEQASFRDNQFLMRQMELRELLDELKYADDVDAALFEANEMLASEFEQLLTTMAQQLAQDSPSANILASENLRKLKFYQKLQHELDRIEDQLCED